METITHPTLVQLVAAGAVRVVVAVGQPGGWSLLVRYGLAERALAANITAVVFDRGGYVYTGRVAELAAGAREAGLEF